jgi:hypothetical protein
MTILRLLSPVVNLRFLPIAAAREKSGFKAGL